MEKEESELQRERSKSQEGHPSQEAEGETASTEWRASDDMKSLRSSGSCKRETCTHEVARLSDRSS